MAATLSYPRPKAAPTISTGLVMTIIAAEKPNSPHVFRDNGGSAETGTTSALDARIQCDADESGGTDIQDLFKIEATPTLGSDGKLTLTVVVTPIKGDASAGTPSTLTVIHDETADVWQTAAGRARQ